MVCEELGFCSIFSLFFSLPFFFFNAEESGGCILNLELNRQFVFIRLAQSVEIGDASRWIVGQFSILANYTVGSEASVAGIVVFQFVRGGVYTSSLNSCCCMS